MARKSPRRSAKAVGDEKGTGRRASNSQQARDHKAKNPNATVQEIADAIKMSYNAVYQALNKAAGTSSRASGKRGRNRKAPESMHGALDTAFEFVQKVGGLVHAESLLDKLKAFKAKL